MILGTGIDLAEVDRIREAVEKYGRRFLERVFTPAEIAYVERKANRYERYAARFAAKEAGMKALGTGWRRGVRWQDFEVRNQASGRPALVLHGMAAEFARQLGVERIHLSLTHTASMAQAFVVLEGRGPEG
ncbi:MAG: holo-[acyl-carrier-protein] synthase [Bryobacteraceae bacterium]|nr:holo-[acyl-carrier-protein] synthase [Bryobacteraceae bacterium]MCX7603496.1 holo-[acyl-carrier-protein] synthase [Bryobacteraceae bacterium]